MFGFDIALWHIKNGKYVTRKAWNGKGTYLVLQESLGYCCTECLDQVGVTEPYIAITCKDKIRPYVPAQYDMLAEDWVLCGQELL